MQTIPITDAFAQTFAVALGGQDCTVTLRQRSTGLYMDLYVGGKLVIGGARCMNRVRTERQAYLGFTGDLVFVDTQGTSDPSSPGLGSRFVLVYLSSAEAADLPP